MRTPIKSLLVATCAVFALSGCATKTLIEQDTGGNYTKTIKQVLVEDSVVAFGKPTTPLANTPQDTIVIVGQKNSYVLTKGGGQFVTLLSYLDPRYIRVTSPLNFYSKDNDGRFTGKLSLKYSQLAEDVKKSDLDFFLRNNVQECTSYNDKELGAKSFCFEIPLEGSVYPAVSNQSSLKPLSKAYPVSIYTEKTETAYRSGNSNPVKKLVLLPFAVAFDVATLPFQALGEIFD